MDTYVAAENKIRSALRDRSTHSRCKSEHLFSQSPGSVDSSGLADKNQTFHSRGVCEVMRLKIAGSGKGDAGGSSVIFVLPFVRQ